MYLLEHTNMYLWNCAFMELCASLCVKCLYVFLRLFIEVLMRLCIDVLLNAFIYVLINACICLFMY